MCQVYASNFISVYKSLFWISAYDIAFQYRSIPWFKLEICSYLWAWNLDSVCVTPEILYQVLLWCSLLLVGSSANFDKKIQNSQKTKPRIQEPAEDNPRTKSVQTPPRKLNSQSFVLLNSFPYRNPPYSKNVGRRYSPQGGFNIFWSTVPCAKFWFDKNYWLISALRK